MSLLDHIAFWRKPAQPMPAAREEAPAFPPLAATDRDALVRTLYGEARGEGEAGQTAVVHVIRNRALQRKTTAAIECHRPLQFSCWNNDDPNFRRVIALRDDSPEYRRLGALVDRAWAAPDSTGGARHYYAPAGMKDGKPPYWAAGGRETLRVGGHIFLAGVA